MSGAGEADAVTAAGRSFDIAWSQNSLSRRHQLERRRDVRAGHALDRADVHDPAATTAATATTAIVEIGGPRRLGARTRVGRERAAGATDPRELAARGFAKHDARGRGHH